MQELLTNKTVEKLKHDLVKEGLINFDDLENVSYDKTNDDEVKIFKTAEILMNKHIYSHNYLDV